MSNNYNKIDDKTYDKNRNVPALRFEGFTDPWVQCKLNNFVEFYSGQTYSPADVQEVGTLILRSSNINDGKIIDADNVYINSEKINSPNVQTGDIIVVVRNGSRSLLGKHAQILQESPKTVIGAFMTGIRSKSPSFVNALLDTTNFYRQISNNLGATINQITNYMFDRMNFIIPIISEQNKIGELISTLNKIITLEQEKLEQLISIYIEFSSRLLIKLPKNSYQKYKLEALFKEINERSSKGELLSVTINNGVIKASENGRDNNYSSDKSNYKTVKKGDIVYNSMRMWQGASGLSKYNGIVSPAYTVIRPKSDINSDYVARMFKTEKFKNIFTRYSQGLTSDTWTLKYNLLKEIKISLPEINYQNTVSNTLSVYETIIKLKEQYISELQSLKQFLLQKLFI